MNRVESHDFIVVNNIFDDQEVDDTDVVSSTAQVYDGKSYGVLFLQADENTGSAHIKVEFVLSHDKTNFLAPLTAADGVLVADFTSTTGVWLQFTLPPCKEWKLKITGLSSPTNGSDIDLHADVVLSAAPQYLG